MSAKHRILLVRAGNTGDMLMISPAVRAVRETYPGADIHLLTGRAGADIYENDPAINRVYVLTHKRLPALLNPAKAILLAKLRKIGLTATVDFETNDLFAKMLKDVSPGIFIGWSGLHDRHAPFDEKAPYWKNCLNLLSHLGIRKPEQEYYIRVPKSDEEFVSGWLKKEGIAGRIIGFNAGNSRTGRKRDIRAWPVEKFAELGRRINEKSPKTAIILTARGKEERETARKIASMSGVLTVPYVLLCEGDMSQARNHAAHAPADT